MESTAFTRVALKVAVGLCATLKLWFHTSLVQVLCPRLVLCLEGSFADKTTPETKKLLEINLREIYQSTMEQNLIHLSRFISFRGGSDCTLTQRTLNQTEMHFT